MALTLEHADTHWHARLLCRRETFFTYDRARQRGKGVQFDLRPRSAAIRFERYGRVLRCCEAKGRSSLVTGLGRS